MSLTQSEITLSPHQLEIADAICNRRGNSVLAGLAGTGKTTVSKFIYERWMNLGVNVIVMAPTGKAASVLRKKGVPAKTIHSVVYHFKGSREDDDGELELLFEDNRKRRFADRFIIDEASMIDAKMRRDIEAKGVPVLYVGDPGQLPPVKGRSSGIFEEDPFILREIHRQAADSPIISWAHRLRDGQPIHTPHPGIEFYRAENRNAIGVATKMIDAKLDRVICKTNQQRVAVNMAYRDAVGRSQLIEAGDEIIICRNNKSLGLVNGDIMKVVNVEIGRDVSFCRLKSIDTDRVLPSVPLWNGKFNSLDRAADQDVDYDIVLADFAYAITCHKFQGSSSNAIGITASGYCGDTAKWNYTAATRAEERITVFV